MTLFDNLVRQNPFSKKISEEYLIDALHQLLDIIFEESLVVDNSISIFSYLLHSIRIFVSCIFYL